MIVQVAVKTVIGFLRSCVLFEAESVTEGRHVSNTIDCIATHYGTVGSQTRQQKIDIESSWFGRQLDVFPTRTVRNSLSFSSAYGSRTSGSLFKRCSCPLTFAIPRCLAINMLNGYLMFGMIGTKRR